MRENRPYGSEGGEVQKPSLPLSGFPPPPTCRFGRAASSKSRELLKPGLHERFCERMEGLSRGTLDCFATLAMMANEIAARRSRAANIIASIEGGACGPSVAWLSTTSSRAEFETRWMRAAAG